MIEFLEQNMEWIFSGVGVAVISWLLYRNSDKTSMSQKSGDNSTNIQVGGSVTTSDKDKSNGNQ